MTFATKVPLMFRAQVEGRSQLQRIDPGIQKARRKVEDEKSSPPTNKVFQHQSNPATLRALQRPSRPGNNKTVQRHTPAAQHQDKKLKQDSETWVDEWMKGVNTKSNSTNAGLSKESYDISWRFVSNSGQDPTIISPVIGTGGLPFYPGSSMKGAFRAACEQAEPRYIKSRGRQLGGKELANYYCGTKSQSAKHNQSETVTKSAQDSEPGILRFHGGYPINPNWHEKLVDLVHPQQHRQVGIKDSGSSSAFAQISLYKPTLEFAISSSKIKPDDEEWQTIWQLWEEALARGIGCRVSAGYGQPQKQLSKAFYSIEVKGEGGASKALDDSGEFRPNIFKAAIRGHTLRIFGGLTNAKKAEDLVEKLFGGIQGAGGTVGLLGINFQAKQEPDIGEFYGGYDEPTYEVTGKLNWSLNREVSTEEEEALLKLISYLTRFAMLLGGFGKSWRRADHYLFYKQYYEGDKDKALIGCQWRWFNQSLNEEILEVNGLNKVGPFLDQVRAVAQEWMQIHDSKVQFGTTAKGWREIWHPKNVQVWGREAESDKDCVAIHWFHGAYYKGDLTYQSIKQTQLTGYVKGQDNAISRIWHRMYPQVPVKNNDEKFFELLTFFPVIFEKSKDFEKSKAFEEFLASNRSGFKKLWGN